MNKSMRFSKWIWGTFMLLAAAFVLANQFSGFVNIGIGSIIAAALATAFLIQCIAQLSFAPLPIPLAVLYIVFQKPLGFPQVEIWVLLLSALFATIGLCVLLPSKHKHKVAWHGYHGHHDHDGSERVHTGVEDKSSDNNPSVHVSFGSVSRYLHSDCLETVQLYCNFGALEVFFDKAQLSPNGAEVQCDCSFAGMTLFVPKHWRIIDRLSCTLGGVEMDNRFAAPAEDAPSLTLTGRVMLGGLEIRYV